ncbi:MAG: hypothetical protein LPJ89_00445 [Hymenobacteraceae bacterium]|nr:hypothetical protein [Hymenobacteraceae bacterium]MDX5396309.1 hypothetical protein [Hymenobacteraceae bacterium]MDX5442233.1 hypothetical protein [Hymenobacteraceae bacterium]MDX5512368.1 hypothetical protein [Hymenobacteraceae bacterium]
MKFILKVFLLVGLLVVSKLAKNELLAFEAYDMPSFMNFSQHPGTEVERDTYPVQLKEEKTVLHYN